MSKFKKRHDKDVWEFQMAVGSRDYRKTGEWAHKLRCRYGYTHQKLFEISRMTDIAEFDGLLELADNDDTLSYGF
jgi:hypothetical protein